jgi:soluble lytic murein transglycosylase-like protein
MNLVSLLSHIGAGTESSSKFAVLMLICAGLTSAQTSPADPVSRMDTSTQRQILSVARMKTAALKASIAAQKRSVNREPGTSPRDEFFLLPPPAGGPPAFVKPQCEPLPVSEVDELVTEAGEASSVSPDLLRSVMKAESGFRPCAVSGKGAMGLMQLMETTASDLGVRNAFDPRENVTAGARLMRQLINLYDGDLPLALSAYNAGSGRVDPSFGIPEIPETVDYVNKVLSVFQASEPAKTPGSRTD